MHESSHLLTNRHTTCHMPPGVIGGFGQHEVGMLRTASANGEKMEGEMLNRLMIRYIAKTIGISLR